MTAYLFTSSLKTGTAVETIEQTLVNAGNHTDRALVLVVRFSVPVADLAISFGSEAFSFVGEYPISLTPSDENVQIWELLAPVANIDTVTLSWTGEADVEVAVFSLNAIDTYSVVLTRGDSTDGYATITPGYDELCTMFLATIAANTQTGAAENTSNSGHVDHSSTGQNEYFYLSEGVPVIVGWNYTPSTEYLLVSLIVTSTEHPAPPSTNNRVIMF